MSELNDLWNNLSENITKQQDREKLEDIAVMIGSIGIAHAIPVLGEIQMGLQFVDFIDPYGYNQAITRESLDKVLVNQYNQIQTMQTNAVNCYQGDAKACADANMGQSELDAFNKLPATLQEKQLKTAASWLTPLVPEVQYADMVICQYTTDVNEVNTRCKDPEYVKYYSDFWTANQVAYQANADAAHQAYINGQIAAAGGSTPSSTVNDGHKKNILYLMIAGSVLILIVFYMITNKVFSK